MVKYPICLAYGPPLCTLRNHRTRFSKKIYKCTLTFYDDRGKERTVEIISLISKGNVYEFEGNLNGTNKVTGRYDAFRRSGMIKLKP